jgi:hypothetical protein
MTTPDKHLPLGTVRGLSAEDYHRDPGISRSMLGYMDVCPAEYKYRLENPREETEAMAFGTMLHAAILEPDTFTARVAFAPEVDRRTKEGKARWEAFLDEAEGKMVATAKQAQLLTGMGIAVHGNRDAAAALSGEGWLEQSFFWIDEATGLRCKARPDFIRADGFIVDVKTCSDASPKSFQRAMVDFGYHRQAAWYTDGVKAGRDDLIPEPLSFLFVAVEKTPPHHVAVYVADGGVMACGRNQCRRLLNRVAECTRRNEWPSYADGVQMLSMPTWANLD